MASRIVFICVAIYVLLRQSKAQDSLPEAVLNCCEGDVLFLLDSSGSVSTYDYTRMLRFLSDLLLPFSLGEDQVQVGLLQVGSQPRLEFGFDAHTTQAGLQGALSNAKALRGNTNTEEALAMAKDWVLRPGAGGGARHNLPRVLVWLTDGVKPGDVIGPMEALRAEGVAVLVVSTGHGNYQVLRQVVSPPLESNLYFVDVDDMSIITEDLRDPSLIIRAERLLVRDVSSNSAVLQWRPVLAGLNGYYQIRYGPSPTAGGGGGGGGGATGTSPGTGGGQYQRIIRPGDSSQVALTGLKPETSYTATLTPESNEQLLRPLSVSFTTAPEVMSPATVTISESGVSSVRVSWGPLQPRSVHSYLVEYSALPGGGLRTVTVGNNQNSTLLRDLQPGTQYLVTVSGRYTTGKERAMSVKACTQEVTPGLNDLQLTTLGSHSVQVDWKGRSEGLRGYWLTWEEQNPSSSSSSAQRSSLYLPPESLSTRLTHLPPAARVCVSPVYRTARGEGLCCTTQSYSNALRYGFSS